MNATMPTKSEIKVHIHTKDSSTAPNSGRPALDAAWLRQLCLDAGADDAGFVELERLSLADERPHIEKAFPPTRSVISFVVRMNRDNVRSPARSVANNEFHSTGDEVDDVARKITSNLERLGIRALNPPMAFPMEVLYTPSLAGASPAPT